MRLLLVEDDQRISAPIQEELQSQNCLVDVAEDGEQGLELAHKTEYDLIVLDLLLPKIDGITLCNTLRMEGYAGPILMMTARGATQDKVQGLDAGADDYLVKPFDFDELAARVRALVRRSKPQKATYLVWGDLEVDVGRCAVTYRGNVVPMTPTEYRLLSLFLRNPNQTLSAESVLQSLWLSEENPTVSVIKAHIKGLRRKLREANISQEVIETVYGFGYRLKPHR